MTLATARPLSRGAIGLAIRVARIRARRGVRESAEAVGVVEQTYIRWEKGVTLPHAQQVVALARLFDTPIEVLLGAGERGGHALLS